MVTRKTTNSTKNAATAGQMMEVIETTVETVSSARLTSALPVPPVETVTTGRAVALTACTLPATSRPIAMAKTVFISITLVLAAKTIAPAAGRMKDMMTSLTLSTAGILSATNSMTERKINIPMIHQLVRPSQGALRVIRWVKRASRATASSGM